MYRPADMQRKYQLPRQSDVRCADMWTGSHLFDQPNMQRYLQYDGDLLRVHHLCLGEYVCRHADMR